MLCSTINKTRTLSMAINWLEVAFNGADPLADVDDDTASAAPLPPSTLPPDRVVEIERLAALDAVNYDVARAEAADRLGIRTQTLDRTVAKKRRALGLETGDGADGQGRAVKIADLLPWHEPVTGDQIATTLAAMVKTYAILPDAAADAISLWVLHTWLVNKFTMSPRLAVTSPTKGCGKTTVLRILNLITRRPKRVGSISPPALFRAVEQFQPTILLDETEKYIEHGSDLHALLNEGHCKGASVWRVLGEKQELREFTVFGAAAFARNGRLPDDLEQRSIIVEMQRRRAGEPLAELTRGPQRVVAAVSPACAPVGPRIMPPRLPIPTLTWAGLSTACETTGGRCSPLPT